MKKQTITLLATALALSLSGCLDPKQANKANFAAAIASGFDAAGDAKRSLCMELPGEWAKDRASFSIEQPKAHFESRDTKYNANKELNALGPLVENGLLERTDSQFKKPWSGDYVRSSFTITETTKPLLREKKVGNDFIGYSVKTWLCVGKLVLVEVNGYTEPADLMGKRVSEVTTTLRYDDLPAWVSNESVTAYWPNTAEASTGNLTRKIALVLTGDGWEIMKD